MIAVANETFKLMPDWTLAIQTGIFVLTAAALSVFVFRPIRTIIERRREFTTEAKGEADKLVEEADQLRQGRMEVLAMVLSETQVERARRLAEASRESDRMVAEAREGTRQIIQGAAVEAENAKRFMAQEMGRRAEEIAESIVERAAQ